jgi:hypothetical protein
MKKVLFALTIFGLLVGCTPSIKPEEARSKLAMIQTYALIYSSISLEQVKCIESGKQDAANVLEKDRKEAMKNLENAVNSLIPGTVK